MKEAPFKAVYQSPSKLLSQRFQPYQAKWDPAADHGGPKEGSGGLAQARGHVRERQVRRPRLVHHIIAILSSYILVSSSYIYSLP